MEQINSTDQPLIYSQIITHTWGYILEQWNLLHNLILVSTLCLSQSWEHTKGGTF